MLQLAGAAEAARRRVARRDQEAGVEPYRRECRRQRPAQVVEVPEIRQWPRRGVGGEVQPGFLRQFAQRGDAEPMREPRAGALFQRRARRLRQGPGGRGGTVLWIEPATRKHKDIRHEAMPGRAHAHQHLRALARRPPQQEAGGVARACGASGGLGGAVNGAGARIGCHAGDDPTVGSVRKGVGGPAPLAPMRPAPRFLTGREWRRISNPDQFCTDWKGA